MSEIRAFLAVDLDDDLKPKINRIIKEFKKIDTNIKYVDLTNLHFTLKFFGNIDFFLCHIKKSDIMIIIIFMQ